MSGPLRHLPVAQKLFASFGVLCLLTIGVGATGLVELTRADHRLERMYSTDLQAGLLLGQLRAEVREARALTATLIPHSPAADLGNIEQAVHRLDADIDDIWARYTAGGSSADAVSFASALAGYRQIRDDSLLPAARAADLGGYLSAQTGRLDQFTSAMIGALKARVAHQLQNSLAMFRC